MEPTIEPKGEQAEAPEVKAQEEPQVQAEPAPEAQQEPVEVAEDPIGDVEPEEASVVPEVQDGEVDVAGDDVGGDAIDQFAAPDEDADDEGVPDVGGEAEAPAEQAENAVEAPAGEDGEAQEAAAPVEPEQKKVTISEALSDFNHELFWQAFNQEVTKVINLGKAPQILVVPADRAHKLLLSAFKNFDHLSKEVNDPKELVFNFQKPLPEGVPEDQKPEVYPVRVFVSDLIPSSKTVDVMMLL